jgi:outer membrane protein OmpA-like peptidoglycan-associated protein
MDSDHGSQSHWIPLADLMTGLMMVFLLLTAAFMLRVEQTTTLVIKEFEETKRELNQALQLEFKQDLKLWNAEMLGDMTIRFKDPEVLFPTGSSTLQIRFKEVLRDFFPRYIAVIRSEKFRDSIREVRIEGHTSAIWRADTDAQTAYFRNMELSQARTRSALEFVLTLPAVQSESLWLKRFFTANGLSSSRPVSETAGPNDPSNQRVEFRIVTNAEERIEKIAKNLSEQASVPAELKGK